MLTQLLSLLRIRPTIGSIEISDEALRFVSGDSGAWTACSVRLTPGVLQQGVVMDAVQFGEALAELKRQVISQLGNHEIRTIIVLSSANVYSQVFRLPAVEQSQMDSAVDLNLAMASPMNRETSYSGWHVAGKDEKSGHLEILSAFVDRTAVDGIIAGLETAGFMAYAVESKALALARLVREQGAGFDAQAPSLVISVDGNGMEFLVMVSGQLHFRYFVSWRDVQGDGREISWDVFQGAFLRHFKQVVGYYGSHWKGELRDVFLSAGTMNDGITSLLGTGFSYSVKILTLTSGEMDPEWFPAAGGALRGLTPPHEDRELNLLGMSARKEFRKREFIGFMKFWRIVVPVALAILLLGAFGADLYLVHMRSLQSANTKGEISQADRAEMQRLAAQVKSFNASVVAIQIAGKDTFKKTQVFELVSTLFSESSTTLTRFFIPDKKNTVTLLGHANSEQDVVRLETAFKAQPLKFQDVNVPLTDLVPADNGVSFSMTFSFIAPKTP